MLSCKSNGNIQIFRQNGPNLSECNQQNARPAIFLNGYWLSKLEDSHFHLPWQRLSKASSFFRPHFHRLVNVGWLPSNMALINGRTCKGMRSRTLPFVTTSLIRSLWAVHWAFKTANLMLLVKLGQAHLCRILRIIDFTTCKAGQRISRQRPNEAISQSSLFFFENEFRHIFPSVNTTPANQPLLSEAFPS